MNNKIKMFIPLVLTFVMFLGSTCFASGAGSSRGFIYNSNQLNSQVIKEFNSMSRAEQTEVTKEVFPLISKSLGFVPKNVDSYTLLNDHYMKLLNGRKAKYNSAQAFHDTETEQVIPKSCFIYHVNDTYEWFNNFAEYLATKISVNGDNLVLNDTNGFYDITNNYIENYPSEHGVSFQPILSVSDINGSNFSPVTLKDKMKELVAKYSASDFCYVVRLTRDYQINSVNGNISKSWRFIVLVPTTHTNLYKVSSNGYKLCNDSGVTVTSFKAFYFASDGNYYEQNGNYGHNVENALGGYDLANNSILSSEGLYRIYSTKSSTQNFYVYDSLNSYLNNKGGFTLPYTLSNYYNNVPTTTINSQQMTQLYNQNYTDNSNNSVTNNTTNNIYYPNDFSPTNDGYDKDSKTLSFDGISKLLESLGNFIGSVINGIAGGIANIVNSLVSVVTNLTSMTDSGFFGFMQAILGWLPTEFITIISASLTIIVLFGIVKLIRG